MPGEQTCPLGAAIAVRYRFLCFDAAASNDGFDPNANRQAEVLVRAPLIDGNFNKSVRILIPEGRTRWPIAQGSARSNTQPAVTSFASQVE